MKKPTRILAALLALAMAFSLGACGKGDDSAEKEKKEKEAASQSSGTGDSFKFTNIEDEEDKEYFSVSKLGKVKQKLNPKDVYVKLDYIPEMFYGEYGLEGLYNKNRKAVEKYIKEMPYKELTIDGEKKKLTAIPCNITAGDIALDSWRGEGICKVSGYYWILCEFYEEGSTYDHPEYVWGAYSIEGDKLVINWVNNYEYDYDKKYVKYEFSGESSEYKFSFAGTKLTLSSGNNSVTITSTCVIDNGLSIDAKCEPDSKKIDDIEKFYIYSEYSAAENKFDTFAELEFTNTDNDEYNDKTMNVYAEATKDGLFTITYQKDDLENDKNANPVITHQFVYFYTGSVVTGGIILTDGKNIYEYTMSDFYGVSGNIDGDEADFSDLSDEEIAELNEKKENLLSDLAAAFESKGIKVAVNEKTGEIAMDTSVLFGGDSAELSADGKKFLNKFIDVYTSIVYSEKYEGFVAKTMVEGHTAPVAGSTYESGLPLSEERAKVVKDYCVSDKTGIDSKFKAKLKSELEDIGYSNTMPVSDKKGNIDMEASRRVSFRFIINIEK